jgi:hypothetical protein
MKDSITQEEWADALVQTWNRRALLVHVLLTAYGVTSEEKLSPEQWDHMVAGTASIRPSITPHTHLRQPVGPWIARHARRANDALWDGKPEAAKKLFAFGTNESTKTATEREFTTLRRQDKQNVRRTAFFQAREADKKHDWKTVK